ncbi:MAG: hypothetical protein IKY52_05355 [Clostridia bacterium]|nr:hypothetical protein [Clostridia bacterium]
MTKKVLYAISLFVEELAFLVSDETARTLFAVASSQDLSHIPAAVFCKLQSRISDAMFSSVKKVRFQTAFRCEQITHETQAVSEIFCETGILRFEKKAFALAEMWFSGTECDVADRELLSQMAEYIVNGGIYGSVENKLKLNRLDNPEQTTYLKSRLFPPYSRMQYEYPVLQKHKFLLPICYLRRWGKLFSKNTARRIAVELKHNNELTTEGQEDFRQMLSHLGLK